MVAGKVGRARKIKGLGARDSFGNGYRDVLWIYSTCGIQNIDGYRHRAACARKRPRRGDRGDIA